MKIREREVIQINQYTFTCIMSINQKQRNFITLAILNNFKISLG